MRPIRASGCILGSAWGVLGASWRDLGASWGGLWSSGGDLGASGGDLGASGGGLGASWSSLLGACWHKVIVDHVLGSILDRFGGPNGSPKEPKMDPKMHQHRTQKSTLDMKSFKSLLDPFWACLGSFSGRSWGQK